MPSLKLTLAALSLLVLPLALHARDLDKSDPVRKQLLDAAREQPDDKFLVKYLIRDGNFAYLCAFKTDKEGNIEATDEDDDVYKYLLIKQGDHWTSHLYQTGLTPKYQESDCASETSKYDRALPANLSADMHAIQSEWIGYMLTILHDEPDPRKWKQNDSAAYNALRAQGVLKTLPVDSAGKDMFHVKLKYDLQKSNICKSNRACNDSADKSLAQLQKLSASNTVSELVWYTCDKSLDNDDKVEHLEQCVTRSQSKPYCRTGMDYFTDHTDVAHCFSEIMQVPVPK